MTGTSVTPVATRLATNISNDGSYDISKTLEDASAIALSLYGALRITPSDTTEM